MLFVDGIIVPHHSEPRTLMQTQTTPRVAKGRISAICSCDAMRSFGSCMSHVAWFVCLCVVLGTRVSCAKTAKSTMSLFGGRDCIRRRL